MGEQAYDPDTGWHQTDYWLSVKWRGEPDSFLLEGDEQEALRTQAEFDQEVGRRGRA